MLKLVALIMQQTSLNRLCNKYDITKNIFKMTCGGNMGA